MDFWKYTLILLFSGIFLDKLDTFTFTNRPQNMTVNIGDDVSLECTVNGSSLYYTWEYKQHKDSSSKDGLVLGFCYRGQDCKVVLWHRQVRITNSSRFTIKNISSDNGGLYSCETTTSNSYEIIKAVAWIFVKTPPKTISIDFNKSQNIFKENELVKVKCSTAGGNPIPKVFISVWANHKISHLKTEQGNPPLSDRNELIVFALWRPSYDQHRGFVMCTANNDAGSLTANSSVVNIKFEPKIHPFKTNNISAMVNQTLDLTCQVTANPPATIQWFINNGLRLIASSQLITTVQSEMAGNITCAAQNPMGSRSQSLKLVVLKEPTIFLEPNFRVKEKSDSSISCRVEAVPEPDFIRWYKVSVDSDNYLTLISNDAKLNFINIDRSSSGKYACVTKNTQKPTDGRVKETTVKKFLDLVVTYLPGEPSIDSNIEVKLQKGDQLRILCSANTKNPGEPFPSLSWIDVDTKDIVSDSGVLFIENSSSVNNGNYQCASKNELGVALSSKIVQIIVNEPPSVIANKKSHVFLGYSFLPQTLDLQCTFKGQPLHTVSWLYQGVKILTNEDYQIITERITTKERATILSSNLTIKFNSPNFAMHYGSKSPPSGIYSCESVNQYGTATFDYSLVIKYPPSIKINPHERKVAGSLGQDFVSMKCQMESIGEPQISWLRTTDSVELPNRNRKYNVITKDIVGYNIVRDIFAPGIKITELRIYDLSIDDFAGYSCVATNDQGRTKGFVELVFKSKPDAPYNVNVTSVDWDSITISWQSGFNGGTEQSFEIQVYSDTLGPQKVPFYSDKIENKLTLKGLHPSTNYTVQLFSVNVIGRSDGSPSIGCVTKRIKKFDSIYAIIVPDQPKVAIVIPDTDLCANLDYTRDGGQQWFNIQHCVKFNESQVNVTVLLDISRLTSMHDVHAGSVHLRLTFCLLSRPGICSNHMILENPKNDNVTTQTVILIIAVICFILIIMLIAMFIVCCIRFKYSCSLCYSYCCCLCCCRRKYHRSKIIHSRSAFNKRNLKHELRNEERISCDETLNDTVMTMGSPSNYCSSLMACSSPHIMSNKLLTRNNNDIYSSFTCQHQTQPPIYYEGSSFLQPTMFSWPQTINSQSYEASSSNSHSSAGSSSRTNNPKSCLRYRANQDCLSNNVIVNQKSLFELNEKMQLPDVTSEAIHFVKCLDTEHVLEAIV